MTPEQQAMQARRLFLEEQIFTAQREIGEISRACTDHIIHKGRTLWSPRLGRVANTMEGKPDNWNNGCYSVSCAVCGKDFGWHCPINPKGYCEYSPEDWSHGPCLHCGIDGERK